MNETGFSDNRILSLIKEVKKTTDTKEAAQLLSSGNWIAIYAVSNGDITTFVLGRVD